MSDDYDDQESYQAAIKSRLADAIDYIDSEIAPVREKALRYYRGDPFGNEEDGRSQIVMTVVRDKIQAMIPSILRVFTSSDQMVEYSPRTEASVEQAAQATDYANHIIYNDNPGFSILHSWIKDALRSKLGIVKVYWSEKGSVSESDYSGLDEGQLKLLLSSEGVELLSQEEFPATETSPPFYDVRIRRTAKPGRVVIEALPPEEFLIARDARDLDTASLVAHRSNPTISELVAMGYDKEEIEEHAGSGYVGGNMEATARNLALNSLGGDNDMGAMRRVSYCESFIRIDKDGDGIAELRKICSLGEAHHILHDEVADDVLFATICPDPEPHMIFGQSVFDLTGDLQLIHSNIVRNTLDSLAQSIHPRTFVLEGAVNMDDVMNNEVGAIVRGRQIGAVQPLTTPFVGQQAMPVLAYMDEIAAQRTGVSAASQGLDPDVLQSTTKAAVTATVQGAQERIELVSRFVAETGLKRLFKLILKLICKHQDQPRIVRMRGKWVTVDPRAWDADLDVQINVALGRGTDQDKIQHLMLILQEQKQVIQTMGLDNPVVSVEQYCNTVSQITALMGFKDARRYFTPVTREEMAAMQQQKPPPPDPNMMLVQIEQKKAEDKLAAEQADHALKVWEAERTHEREMQKLTDARMLAVAKIEAEHQTTVDVAAIKQRTDLQTAHIKAEAQSQQVPQ